MSDIVGLIRDVVVIVIVIFILWLLSEGYINQAINFLVENPWGSIIIIIAIFLFLAFLSWAWRKISEKEYI